MRKPLILLWRRREIENAPGSTPLTNEHQNRAIGTSPDAAIVPTSASKCANDGRVETQSSELSQAGSERAAALADLFLRACAIGAPCDDLAVALANAVVDAAGVRLALEVLEGGEHRFARATVLAGRVLDAVHVAAKAKESGHG